MRQCLCGRRVPRLVQAAHLKMDALAGSPRARPWGDGGTDHGCGDELGDRADHAERFEQPHGDTCRVSTCWLARALSSPRGAFSAGRRPRLTLGRLALPRKAVVAVQPQVWAVRAVGGLRSSSAWWAPATSGWPAIVGRSPAARFSGRWALAISVWLASTVPKNSASVHWCTASQTAFSVPRSWCTTRPSTQTISATRSSRTGVRPIVTCRPWWSKSRSATTHWRVVELRATSQAESYARSLIDRGVGASVNLSCTNTMLSHASRWVKPNPPAIPATVPPPRVRLNKGRRGCDSVSVAPRRTRVHRRQLTYADRGRSSSTIIGSR